MQCPIPKRAFYDCFLCGRDTWHMSWRSWVFMSLWSEFRRKSFLGRGMFDRGPFAHGPVPSKRGLESIAYFFVYRIISQVPGMSCLKYHALCNGRPQMQSVLKLKWKLNELQEVQKSSKIRFGHVLSALHPIDIRLLPILPPIEFGHRRFIIFNWQLVTNPLSILQLSLLKCALLIWINFVLTPNKASTKDCSSPSVRFWCQAAKLNDKKICNSPGHTTLRPIQCLRCISNLKILCSRTLPKIAQCLDTMWYCSYCMLL